jgi:predicted ATPase
VFAGGWKLWAAERVLGGEAIKASDVVDLTAQSVNKTLVLAEEPYGPQRYRLLEPVQQYAHELFVPSGEEETIRR